jgi:hypothetical protein
MNGRRTRISCWKLVALASFMLLSVTKAAHAAVSGDAWQEIRGKCQFIQEMFAGAHSI